MWQLVILCSLGLSIAERVTFDDYRVFRLKPTEQSHIEILRELTDVTSDYSFWQEPTFINRPVDLMVSPNRLKEFKEIINSTELQYETLIENVQHIIDVERHRMTMDQYSSRYSEFSLSTYHTLEEIYDYLDSLAKTYPDKVEVVVGGHTYEGRQIKGVKVTFGKKNPGVFIEGGIHAREWIAPATVLYILNQLLTSKDRSIRNMADKHNWYIFPSVNPDGYVYTHLENRLWRKTRKPYTARCVGADPNRNWGYQWGNGGVSSNPCSDIYPGSSPFSEVETKTMSQYIKSISNQFYAYIAFHSYSQLVLFPYGHTHQHLDNYDEELAIGKEAVKAIAKRHGKRYVTGSTASTIYIASGCSMDWVKGTLRKPITYTYELRDTGAYGFFLPPKQIIPTGEEVVDSLVVMLQAAAAYNYTVFD